MTNPKDILVVTTSSVEGLIIKQYLKPITAHIVGGTNLFSDIFASFSDFFGGRSQTYQNHLTSLYNEAIENVKFAAYEIGANCIVGLNIDRDEISGKGKSMFMLTAIGTAVNIEEDNSQRAIEPIGIYYMGEHWYLIAYCLLRKDYRTFKFSNISKLVIAEEHFDKLHPSLQTFLSKKSKDKKLHTVVLLVDKTILQYFGDQKYYNGFVSQKDRGDKVEMIFVTASLIGFSRWYLIFGDHADIINPPELKEVVASLIDAIAKKIN